MLRCKLPDEPGWLAALAGTIAELGGDIQAVDVVEHTEGHVLDDLLVVIERDRGAVLLERLEALSDIELVHAGPSRGHPGDAVTRLAFGLEALLTGQAAPDSGLATLIGGQLRASQAELLPRGEAPQPSAKTLVLDVDHRVLVLTRDYRFTATERERAGALIRLSLLAAGQPAWSPVR
jgi:hypothetical protein